MPQHNLAHVAFEAGQIRHHLRACPTLLARGKLNQPKRSTVLFSCGSLDAWLHLQVHIDGRGLDGQLADLAISGLAGWVALHAGPFQSAIKMQIWCPKGIEAFCRPAMPMPDPFIS